MPLRGRWSVQRCGLSVDRDEDGAVAAVAVVAIVEVSTACRISNSSKNEDEGDEKMMREKMTKGA